MKTSDDVVSEYFESWETFDTKRLYNIFESRFSYDIEGKKKFSNWEDLCAYWRRNAARQKKLSLNSRELKGLSDDFRIVFFRASFLDTEVRDYVRVSGVIYFKISNENRISELWEIYDKNYMSPTSAIAGRRLFVRYAINLKEKLSPILRKIFEYSWKWAVFSVFSITVFVLFLLYMSNFHQDSFYEILSALEIVSRVPQDEWFAMFHRYVGSALGVISVILALYSIYISFAARKSRSETTYPLSYDGRDLEIMCEYYETAERVTVFAGDFSFLTGNEKLRVSVLSLLDADKIRLVTFKGIDVVTKALEGTSYGQELLDHPNFLKNLIGKSGVRMKFSVVETRGREFVLYRYSPEGGYDRICVLKDLDQNRYALQVIRQLSNMHAGYGSA